MDEKFSDQIARFSSFSSGTFVCSQTIVFAIRDKHFRSSLKKYLVVMQLKTRKRLLLIKMSGP